MGPDAGSQIERPSCAYADVSSFSDLYQTFGGGGGDVVLFLVFGRFESGCKLSAGSSQ